MQVSCSRRAFMCALPALATGQQLFPSERSKYRDPATEFDLLRLTDPTLSSCYLPTPPRRAISARNNSLVYCSDRSGKLQTYRMDLKSGESKQMTSAGSLDRSTVSLLPDDRTICFCDGQSVQLSGGRTRTVYSIEHGWIRGEAFVVSEDGNHAVVSERRENHHRLQLIPLGRGSVATIAESDAPILALATRPKRSGVMYLRPDGLWLVNYDGQQNRKLRTGQGSIAAALWSADGRSIFYINRPSDRAIHEMRECVPDLNEDRLIAPTTQFVNFTRNRDGSVFVGVSGSKGSPYILLLLRAARRELTIAEHRASDAHNVSVQFSPNSQVLYYHTDREGKPAIYSIALERFVENTDEENAPLLDPGGGSGAGFGA